jgi:hypothetical protein
MEIRQSTSGRWLRALFAGSFAFFLGVVGHLMAAGLLPGTAFLVVLYVFTIVLSVPVLARPGSSLRMLGLLVGGQTFIHLCLTLTAGHVGDPKVASTMPPPVDTGFGQLPTVGGRRVGSLQDAFVGSNQMPRTTPTLPIHHLIADMSANAPMMVVHLIAAALVALWLAYGEQVVLGVLALTARLLVALVRPALAVTAPLRALRDSLTEVAVPGFRDVLLCRSVSRRGPPLLAG